MQKHAEGAGGDRKARGPARNEVSVTRTDWREIQPPLPIGTKVREKSLAFVVSRACFDFDFAQENKKPPRAQRLGWTQWEFVYLNRTSTPLALRRGHWGIESHND